MAKKEPRLSVLERRTLDPFGEPSAPIGLKDRSLVCRWFNAAIMTDKIWRAKQKGWTPVRPDDVSDLDQIGGFGVSPDGAIVRGDRGQEVLMAMPRDAYRQIEMAKARVNREKMRVTRDEIQQAAAERLGDEALQQGRPIGSVQDSYERIRVDPE